MHNAILCATQACYRFWIVPHFSQTYIDRPVSSNRAGANIHARIGDSNIRHITGHKNDHHHGCALCRSNSILSESNGSMGSSHMTVCEPGHLGYKEYTSELLPVLPSGLLSGTAVSSGRLSTGERLSESNDSAKDSATMSWTEGPNLTLLRAPDAICSPPFRPISSFINLIPSASAFFTTSVYLQPPAEVSIIFLVCKPFSSTSARRRVCSRPSIATYFVSSSHRRRYQEFLFSCVQSFWQTSTTPYLSYFLSNSQQCLLCRGRDTPARHHSCLCATPT